MEQETAVAPQSGFQSASVHSKIALDDGPGRWRIGLIVLSNDYATEPDFMNMRPSNDVAIFTTRIANTPECTPDGLRQMAPKITDCAALLVPDGRLDAVAYSCTSGTAVIGYEGVRDRIQSARPSVPCITPITASLAALEKFDATRIAVLTPYVDDVNTVIHRHLTRAGKDIVAFSSFGIEDNEEMAALTPGAIYQAAIQADRQDAEALFISCTAIRAAEVVDRIEQALGKPVVTANQAMFWHALRAAGCDLKSPGYGCLLRDW